MHNGKIEVTDAILAINPNASARVISDDLDRIDWYKETPVISKSDLQAKIIELQAEYDAKDYARKREGEYPATKDFMEAYTEKEIGGDTTKWDAYVINYNKVRTENPK
jgi:hypothetical protein